MAYSVDKARELVLKAGLELCEAGLVARTWGNISARVSDTQYVITPSGRAYDTLTKEDIVLVNIADGSYNGEVKPSGEKGVHAAVYELCPEMNFVIHTHQSNASAVAAMGLKSIKLDKEYPGIGDEVFCADYGLPGTKKLCKNTAGVIGAVKGQAVMMSSHGALCYGSSYEEAFAVARTLEEACGKYLENLGVHAWKEGESPFETAEAENVIWNNSPAVMKFMEARKVLKPYLDDFAQLAGTSMKVIDESPKAIEDAIKNNTPVLVRGKGALCVAKEKGDAEALSIVIEKNCRAALAAIGSKPINPLECALMRLIYLKKYSKQSK